MKKWQIIKTILYIAGGIVVLVLNQQIMSVVGYVVGAVVFLYGVEMIAVSIAKRPIFAEETLLFDGLIHILIAVILFIVANDIVKVCLVWAIWSIIREGKELTESLHSLSQKKPGLINAIESVIIIAFSFTMILEPSEHHAHTHVIILGIELMLEVLFPLVNMLYDKISDKKTSKSKK